MIQIKHLLSSVLRPALLADMVKKGEHQFEGGIVHLLCIIGILQYTV